MDTIEELEPGSRILLGVSVNEKSSSELLSLAIGTISKPSDTIIALHVLECSGKNSLKSEKSKFRKAKAFVISLLGDFVKPCEAKQVRLEARVCSSPSIGAGLTQEAILSKSTFLIIGNPKNSNQRSSFEIPNHCFKHAPNYCSVIIARTQTQNGTHPEPEKHEDDQISSSTGCTTKKESTLQKLLKAYSKRERKHSLSSEGNSPKAVLEWPDHEIPNQKEINEIYSSPSSSGELTTGQINRTNIWRRLSFVKSLLPSLFALEASSVKESDLGSNCTDEQKPIWRCFSFEEISVATDNFNPENMVGRGGYAEVYKGILGNSQSIAIKRLAEGKTDENKEKEFLAELGILGHVCHPNTAYLIGCCIENGLYLIFDFCPNGTLASALYGNDGKSLEWSSRYKIALGVARGLHYLHECCRHRIIHRDIKASNILLGEDFEPQITDFGLAKWLPKNWSHHSVLPIEGTFGYLAPEYFMHGVVDEKTDVFAFGVILLEIVSGRRAVDCSKKSLLQWAKPLLETGKICELIDPALEDKYDENQIDILVNIASRCIGQPSPWRPSMSEVLNILSEGDGLRESQRWKVPEEEAIDEQHDDSSVNRNNLFPLLSTM
ncbi:hypothetical protein LUZ60_008859 [Juncus effusus]|nr:hypothetical protein LUZ60_008859 [Juncus effusus]